MSLVESFFLGKVNTDMFIAFAAVDLSDDVKSNGLVLFDISEPVVKFSSVLRSDNFIKDFLCH